ncbi:hypothetical protein Tco_0975018 [Tanacetum coccineum]|uniref:Uncharacterized protein n=1 Tax=Tanacetum coccineum TaxID=301880 RepID=A0ABQ5EDC1_9ASTR
MSPGIPTCRPRKRGNVAGDSGKCCSAHVIAPHSWITGTKAVKDNSKPKDVQQSKKKVGAESKEEKKERKVSNINMTLDQAKKLDNFICDDCPTPHDDCPTPHNKSSTAVVMITF